jgi:hypothetical protein
MERQRKGKSVTAEHNPGDWSTSYSQYLTRSAALSARTWKLYVEALERISQGKLTPTVFQEHFPRFAQAHASEYSTRLAEAGARFLAELLQLSASLGQQRPGSDSPDPEAEMVPPRFDASNPVRWFEQLAEYAGELNARAVKAYRAQLDRVAAGEATPSEVQQTTSDYLARQLPEYLQRMTHLYFDLLNVLSDVRARYEETYFRGVLRETRAEESEAPAALTLVGPSGETVSALLAVTNTAAARARIGYTVTEVRRTDGVGKAFVPAVTVFPETLELEPNEEGTLTLSLRLDPLEYDPEALYTGTLYVTGSAGLQVEVQLRILAGANPSDNADTQLPA